MGRGSPGLSGAARRRSALTQRSTRSGHVVLPGLVNTHHHFYQTLTRAHPAAINKALFPWLVALYPIWARLKPNHLRLASRLALTELMLSGCTTAADHHYLYPDGLENAVDIEVEEARSLGMRMTVSRGSMNLSEKDGGLPPDSVVQDEADDPCRQRAGAEAVPRSEAGRAHSRRARALFAVLDLEKSHDREREACRTLRLPASHPSLRDRGRRTVLPRDVWLEAGRSSRRDRLDVEPRLARARRSFQCRGDRAAWQGKGRNLPLRGVEHGARVGHLSDLRAWRPLVRRWASASTARPPTIPPT